jgi:hypothetical protein
MSILTTRGRAKLAWHRREKRRAPEIGREREERDVRGPCRGQATNQDVEHRKIALAGRGREQAPAWAREERRDVRRVLPQHVQTRRGYKLQPPRNETYTTRSDIMPAFHARPATVTHLDAIADTKEQSFFWICSNNIQSASCRRGPGRLTLGGVASILCYYRGRAARTGRRVVLSRLVTKYNHQ